MPWLIGVDEAGYGPNLGPFVMTAVACRLPDDLAKANLWQALATAVRRHGDKADRRMLVDDSKLVYSSASGLGALEAGALTLHAGPVSSLCLGSLLDGVDADPDGNLHGECWYTGQTELPAHASGEVLAEVGESFHGACRNAGMSWAPIRSVVVVPSQFNDLVDRWGTKGAVLGHALGQLVRQLPGVAGEPVGFVIDKHGGRNHYSALLQEAVSEGMVVALEEGADRSSYRVLGGPNPLSFTFQPRADSEHMCVALASMFSKYLRELLMREFNEFWLAKVPGLKSTAGYPSDAKRFYEAIRPQVERLGMADRGLWRSR